MAESGDVGGEEDIVQRTFAPLAAGFPGAFGLTDDCAALSLEPGHDLVITTDPIIAGVHFPPGEFAHLIGWKALAVNISDLAAKGAKPLAYVMALALPETPTGLWLREFASGLASIQKKYGCHLIGGDTERTPGPLTVSITAFGTVPSGALVRRSTARAGDAVYVTGSIGDATLGRKIRHDPLTEKWRLDSGQLSDLRLAYNAPEPVLGFGEILRAHASAAIDVSDGLVKDFERLCGASGVGGQLEAELVPLSESARFVLDNGGTTIAELITGGEDYQILTTIPAEHMASFESAARTHGTSVTRIGGITEERPVFVRDNRGSALDLALTGWDHFRP